MRTPFVGGNWKMNTDRATGAALAGAVAEGTAACDGVEVAVFPPFPYLVAIAEALRGSRVAVGAQDLYPEKSGAFTGEVSAAMRIIYGGSLKPENAEGLLAQPDVDGGLVGGASLSAADFCALVRTAAKRAGRPVA